MSTCDFAMHHSLLSLDSEKSAIRTESELEMPLHNPVVESSEYAYKATNLIQVDANGVKVAANYIRRKLEEDSYTPRTWRTHPLHICPPEPYDPTHPLTKTVLDWIFLISSLNFSFWSPFEGTSKRYGVEWYASWEETEKTRGRRQVFTGYWSLVASLDRALWDEDVPFVNPEFYSSETTCPDSLIEYIFRPVQQSAENMPLIRDRIRIMRENGSILCNCFGGSFKGFIDEFHHQYHGRGSALDLVKMIIKTFPSFRDQVWYQGRTVYFWKRAQILAAELWAAFYPESPATSHPLFPGPLGPRIQELTMFADYRVPQILHHLRILDYPSSLMRVLQSGADLAHGCREEVSLRAASIIAVERVREEIVRSLDENLINTDGPNDLEGGDGDCGQDSDQEVPGRGRDTKRDSGGVSSVLIDFYLWDLAKRIESGEETVDGIETAELVPIHHTRSIWY